MGKAVATASKYGADALIIVLLTTLVIGILRDNDVEISGANEEMIVALAVMIVGRFGVWIRAKIKDKANGKTGQ